MKYILNFAGCWVFASLILFVLLNAVIGCESWNNPQCVTPAEFLEMMIP